MDASFSITVDPVRSHVRVVLSGFFSIADVAQFVAARNREHLKLCCGPNEHLTSVDITGMKIQSQESVEQFTRVLADPSLKARRLAFVVDASLARMQAKRAAAGRDIAFFRTRSEAESWVFGLAEQDGRRAAA